MVVDAKDPEEINKALGIKRKDSIPGQGDYEPVDPVEEFRLKQEVDKRWVEEHPAREPIRGEDDEDDDSEGNSVEIEPED